MGHSKHRTILLIFSVIFFVIYLFLSWRTPLLKTDTGSIPYLIFNQPDESANYFFLRNLVLHGSFGVPEALSALANNQVHARSMTVVHGALVPIGFPTLIVLFGFLMKVGTFVFGQGAFNVLVVVVTPLCAVIAPLFLYGFLRRIFSARVAMYSALLLYVLPPWWYYASRALQPNTLFVTCLIIALYALVRSKKTEKHQVWFALLSGFSFGLSVAVRPFELVWVSTIILFLAVILWKRWYWRARIGLAVGLIIGLALLFFANTLYYGQPFSSGYVKPTADGVASSVFAGPQGIPIIKSIVAPFGWSPKAMARTAYEYGPLLFPAWFLATSIGALSLLFFAKKNRERKYLVYLGVYAFVAVFLLGYYGSRFFADNLMGSVSIGSSQVRYFLPLYVFALPFIAWVVETFFSHPQTERYYRVGATGIFCLFVLLAWRAVFLPFEGLLAINNTISDNYSKREYVYGRTEKDSVIVTRYADKYIFPERKVIPGLTNDEKAVAVLQLVKHRVPVYYYDLSASTQSLQELFLPYGLDVSAPEFLQDSELRQVTLAP